MDWQTSLNSLTLPTPIVLVSGHFGFAEHLASVPFFPWSTIGAIVLKGTTAKERLGYQGNRIIETPYGLLNAVGLENPGVDRVIADKLNRLPKKNIRWIANVAGSTIEEYQYVCQRFNESIVDALEINISCPNVQQGGAIFGNNPAMAGKVIAACRAVTNKTIIAKLSPNQTDVTDTARHCIDSGADILSAINTVSGMMIDIDERRPSLQAGQGGVSGAAIFPIALLNVYKIYQVARKNNIPIIAQGGISNGEQAVAMLLAGASAIGIGSAVAKDIRIIDQILKFIEGYCQRHQYQHFSEITGNLQTL